MSQKIVTNFVVLCKSVALLIYDCILLSQSTDVLYAPECFGQHVNPWICIMINAIYAFTHCLAVLVTNKCPMKNPCMAIAVALYYIPGAITTFVTYTGIEDKCQIFMDTDYSQLSFMIAFHTWLHTAIIVAYAVFVCFILFIVPTKRSDEIAV
jgi:hypothetical protein